MIFSCKSDVISYRMKRTFIKKTSSFSIEQFTTQFLSQFSYYIQSENQACIIDPMREIEPYMTLLDNRESTLKYIFETHIHSDFVSGHQELAKSTKAKIIFGPNTISEQNINIAEDLEEFKLGKIKIKVIHCPGHTLESSMFLLIDENNQQQFLFSGDCLLVNDVGRPDLNVVTSNYKRDNLAAMIFTSLRGKISKINNEVIVLPGHGQGSYFGNQIKEANMSTIQEEKANNFVFKSNLTQQEFVLEINKFIPINLDYFPLVANMNRNGCKSMKEIINQSTTPMSLEQFKAAMHKGAIIIDCRCLENYMKYGYIPNSILISYNFGVALRIAMILKPEDEYIFLTDQGYEKEMATRFARVGYDKILGYLEGGIQAWMIGKNPTIKSDFVEPSILKYIQDQQMIVDVRGAPLYKQERLQKSVNIPINSKFLIDGYKQIPKDQDIYLHCKTGETAQLAISLLRRQGYKNRLLNIIGGIDRIKDEEPDLVIKE